MFQVFDREKTGFMSIGEFRNVMTTLGEDMTSNETDHMVKDADLKGEGFVNIDGRLNMKFSTRVNGFCTEFSQYM